MRFALLAVVLMNPLVIPQQPLPTDAPKQERVQPLMQAKLEAAKDILEGLTLENYEQVGTASRKLKLLSLEAGWNVIQTQRYRFESEEFRRNCDSLSEAAARKDTGRVAVGYIAMTVRCVECHDYMRKQARELQLQNQPHSDRPATSTVPQADAAPADRSSNTLENEEP